MSGSVIVSLTVGGTALRVLSLVADERLHGSSRYVALCAAFRRDGEPFVDDPHALTTQEAELAWEVAPGEERRKQKLYVDEVETLAAQFRCTLTTAMGLLEETCEHRVFVDRDVVDIATSILAAYDIAVTSRVDRTLPLRKQSIQQFEPELAYVSRILAEEGITWFEADDGGVVFVDAARGFDRHAGAIPVRERAGLASAPSVFVARVERAMVVDTVALRDYDFERPLAPLDVAAGEGSRRVYEFPGGYVDPTVGRALAEIRLGERQQRGHVLRGRSTVRALRPGLVIELDAADADHASGEWLVVAASHQATEAASETPFVTRFEAVPADRGYRPARTPAPHLGGVHTAVVTGAAGGEIHTEEHARVRLHHRWDRTNAPDDRASQWSRVNQPQTSGSIFLPRVGWEVLVGFAGRDRDEPVVVGQLQNGVARPPTTLPAKKVVSAFGTLSTPKGSAGHLFEIDDSAGAEVMRFVSSKDFIEKTEKDKVTAVTEDDEWEVGSRTFTIGKVFQRGVTGAQDHTVVGLRTASVGSNFGLTAASELVVVGGLRLIRTGGDLSNRSATWIRVVVGAEGQLCVEHYNRFVQGASVVLTKGAWHTLGGLSQTTGVGGANILRVGGPKSVKCNKYLGSTVGVISEKYASRSVDAGGNYHDKFTVSGKYEFGGDATFKGTNVTFEAATRLVLKAGGVTITLTPGKIVVSGKLKGSVKSTEGDNSTFG